MSAERLGEIMAGGATPLIRTDFDDDAAWARVRTEVTAQREFDGSPYGPYEPLVTVLDDRALEGTTGDSLAALVQDDAEARGYVVLADAQSMAEAARGETITIVYVDLSVDLDEEDEELIDDSFLGRTFRCAVDEFASTEANLSIANLDFSDFADHVGADGVFRGFPDE